MANVVRTELAPSRILTRQMPFLLSIYISTYFHRFGSVYILHHCYIRSSGLIFLLNCSFSTDKFVHNPPDSILLLRLRQRFGLSRIWMHGAWSQCSQPTRSYPQRRFLNRIERRLLGINRSCHQVRVLPRVGAISSLVEPHKV